MIPASLATHVLRGKDKGDSLLAPHTVVDIALEGFLTNPETAVGPNFENRPSEIKKCIFLFTLILNGSFQILECMWKLLGFLKK